MLMRNVAVLITVIVVTGCVQVPDSLKPVDYLEQQEQSRAMECSYGVFIPKSYPLQIINIVASFATNDPNNAIIGSVLAKCVEGKNNQHLVCGIVARRNSVGYIDNATKFYGIYFLDKSDFKIKGLGKSAEKLCEQNHIP